MNNLYIAVLILFTLIVNNIFPQVDSSYKVADWQGFRASAVSFTLDDGTSKQFSVAIPLFDEYNFKVTLFTVINWSSSNWNALRNASADGHEVSSHTMSHPHLPQLNVEQQTAELEDSKAQINTQIPGEQCITLAYPYCESISSTLCGSYYIAARGCSGSIEPKTPSNFFNISSVVCGPQGPLNSIKNFRTWLDNTAASKGWLVLLLHGIDNDGSWSDLASDTLRGALDYINSDTSKFWVSTFSNVVRYIRERKSISIDEISLNDSIISCQVADTLQDQIFNIPVTIKRILPDGWSSATVSQGNSILSSTITETDSVKYVMFDAVPDRGDVIIKKSGATGIYENRIRILSPQLMQNYPNPFNPSTKIKFSIPAAEKNFSSPGQEVSIKVFNVLGKEIVTLLNGKKAPGNYELIFNAAGLPSGVYFYRLAAGSYMATKKMILLF